MKKEEQIVKDYLLYLGYTEKDIVYEPIVNETPDFLINGNIAIEVRRLNQNFIDSIKNVGFENTRIPLEQSFSKLLQTFDCKYKDKSYYVMLKFCRPIPKVKTNINEIKSILEKFVNYPSDELKEYSITKNIKLSIQLRTNPISGRYFINTIPRDQDTTFWQISELAKNIQICSDEKKGKVLNARNQHLEWKEWWLILVDQVGFGLSAEDKESFNNQISINHNWDKLLLIDPSNLDNVLEI